MAEGRRVGAAIGEGMRNRRGIVQVWLVQDSILMLKQVLRGDRERREVADVSSPFR